MSAATTERPLNLTAAARPDLRLLPAPSGEPPYDDERPGGRPLALRPASLGKRPLQIVPSLPTAGPGPLLPPAGPFAHALVQRVLEVLAGVRPLRQLHRLTTVEVYDALEALLTTRPRCVGVRPDGRSIRSIRVQQGSQGVAEVSATVRRGDRYAALALRLEGIWDGQGAWRCTELVGA